MKRRPLASVCLAIVFLFYLKTLFINEAPSDFLKSEGEMVTITGIVKQKEQTNQDGLSQCVVYLQMLLPENKPDRIPHKKTKEQVICYLKPNQNIPKMGSMIQVKGILKKFTGASNPGQFDTESYYKILKISFQLNQTEIQQQSISYHSLKEALYQFRKKCAGILDSALPAKEASILKNMLLGEKRAADENLKALYQQNGIAHILAISGLHISLLGMTLYKLLKKMGTPAGVQTLLPMLFIAAYVCMTGFAVSALRAMIMFVLQMTARLLKRTYDSLTAVSLAAVLILAEQPFYLYHSGFLFSFGCIYAIALVVPAMTCIKKKPKEGTKKEREPEGIRLRFLSGLALQASCLPLQLTFFYQIPLYAALLNLVVIPLMSFLVPAGVLLLLFFEVQNSLAVFGVGLIKALIVGILAVYEESCRLLLYLPGHLLTLGKPAGWQITGYLVLLAVLVLHKDKLTLKRKWLILLTGAMLLCMKLPQDMEMTFLDVGQGDCIYIRSKEGSHYLVDGGSLSVLDVGKYRIIPFLKYKGVNLLEAVFVTHGDADHCNGVQTLLEQGMQQGIVVKKIYLPDVSESVKTESYKALEECAKAARIEVCYLTKGQILQEKELNIHCLHPQKIYESSDSNENSMVLYVTYGAFHALLTGDVEGNGEHLMLQELAMLECENPLTVLKVSHHGSAYATPEELLMMIKPIYTVISCGQKNSYGHPHPELLQRLQKHGADIKITYQRGAITFSTDGKHLRVTEFLEENN